MPAELKKARLVVEMTIPAHFDIARTAGILETRLAAIYPEREVSVHEYNRVAAAADAAKRRVARGMTNEELLAAIEVAIGTSPPIPRKSRDIPRDAAFLKRLQSGTPLEVPYADRAKAAALGAHFDDTRRKWVVLDGDDLGPFLVHWRLHQHASAVTSPAAD